jgi:hypothetical protein
MNPLKTAKFGAISLVGRSEEAKRLNPHLFGENAGKPTDLPSKVTNVRKKSTAELAMERQLDFMKAAGQIVSWEYEPIRLRIGDGAWYKPDFMVELPNKRIRLIETKGKFKWAAAIVRFKAAKKQYPMFEFEMWEWSENQWKRLY